jgi:hypothetical protein
LVNGGRGQSSVEATILITLMIVFLLVFFVVLAQRSIGNERGIFDAALSDVADLIKTEVQLAYLAEGNYQRNFSIPTFIRGREYTINFYTAAELGEDVNVSTLVMNTSPPFQFAKEVSLPKAVVFGDICKGYNVISKNSAGEITIKCSS